jgi:hypothetical protein
MRRLAFFFVYGHRSQFRADIVADAAGGTRLRLEFGIMVALFVKLRTHGNTLFRALFYADTAPFAVFRCDGNAVHYIPPEDAAFPFFSTDNFG